MTDNPFKPTINKIRMCVMMVMKNRNILKKINKQFNASLLTERVRDTAKTALIKAGRDPELNLFRAMISSFKVVEDEQEGIKLLIKEDWENETLKVNEWERQDGGRGETYVDTDMLYHIFDKGRQAYTIHPRGDNESQVLAIPPEGMPYDPTNEDNTIIAFGNVPAMEGAEFTDAANEIYDNMYSDFITEMVTLNDEFDKIHHLIDEIIMDIEKFQKDGLL